jgi:membrane protease YdiL (CAAX protease family)
MEPGLDAIVSILAIVGILMVLGVGFGMFDRSRFHPGWLLAGGALIVVNDAALTNLYGLLPDFLGGEWNWQGKLIALAITLAVASRIGWRESGLTLRQAEQGRVLTWSVFAVTAALFAALALMVPDEAADLETLAFQWTMPGLEEEPFYRGVLLLAFDRALGVRRMLGAELGWGGLLVTLAFGLAHGFSIDGGAIDFDPVSFTLTAGPSLVLLWLRSRTGSLLLPIVAHNLANGLSLVI